jgi:preprotein translocase subunit Sec61beta
MAEEKISMPMSSAGIIGFSPDVKMAGFGIDPKIVIIAVLILVLTIKFAGILIRT